MSTLAGLPPALADHDWSEQPASGLSVFAGDLWVLSWDGTYRGLVCVAAVKDGYILGWPVTLADQPAFAPALVVARSPLNSPVNLWPTRETGLGMHLLHKPLGKLLDPEAIQPLSWALEDGEDPGLPFASGSAADPANAAADEAMVERWETLCFHTWPESTSPQYLSETKVKRAGGTAMGVTHVG